MSRTNTIWTRSFICIMLSSFFTAMVFYLLGTTIAGYFMGSYGVSESQAGVGVGSYAIGAVIARLFVGNIIGCLGKRRLAYLSSIAYAILAMMYLSAESFYMLVFIRLLHGVSFGMSNTVLNTIAIEDVPVERRGMGTAVLTLSPALSTAIGPFVGLMIIQSQPYTVVLWVCIISSWLGAVLIMAAGVKKDNDANSIHLSGQLSWKSIIEPTTVPIGIVFFLACVCYSSITAFIGLYADTLEMTSVVSYFFIVYSIGILVFRPVTGKLIDGKKGNNIMYVAIIFFSVGFIVLSSAKSAGMLLLPAVCTALGFGTILSGGHGISVKQVSQGRVGIATATFYLCGDLGNGVGPSITGTLVSCFGYENMYKIMALVMLIAFVIYYCFSGRKQCLKQRVNG